METISTEGWTDADGKSPLRTGNGTGPDVDGRTESGPAPACWSANALYMFYERYSKQPAPHPLWMTGSQPFGNT